MSYSFYLLSSCSLHLSSYSTHIASHSSSKLAPVEAQVADSPAADAAAALRGDFGGGDIGESSLVVGLTKANKQQEEELVILQKELTDLRKKYNILR